MNMNTGPNILLFTRNTPQPQRETLPQSKGLEKAFQSNGLKKQAGVAILISTKTDFKLKSIRRDEEKQFILIRGTICQEEVLILNIYDPNVKAPTYVNETLLQLKAYIKPHTLKEGDFKTPVSQMDRSIRQKLNREIGDLADVMNQMDLADIYRTFPQNRKEYSFSASHGTFSKIDHIIGNKANIRRYKEIVVNTCVLSNHHGIKLEFSNNSTPRKSTNSWKLNSQPLNLPLDKKEIKKLKSSLNLTKIKSKHTQTYGTL